MAAEAAEFADLWENDFEIEDVFVGKAVSAEEALLWRRQHIHDLTANPDKLQSKVCA